MGDAKVNPEHAEKSDPEQHQKSDPEQIQKPDLEPRPVISIEEGEERPWDARRSFEELTTWYKALRRCIPKMAEEARAMRPSVDFHVHDHKRDPEPKEEHFTIDHCGVCEQRMARLSENKAARGRKRAHGEN